MKDKKDILFLCQFFYPEYVSSATLPFDTAVALSEAGFSVGVLCGYPKEYSLEKRLPLEQAYDNISIKRLKYIQLKRVNFLWRIINYFSFTFKVLLNIGYLRGYKAVMVYSNPPVLPVVPALANMLFKSKVIFVCYDVYPEIAYATNTISKSGLLSKVMESINKFVFNRMTKVVALSNEMKEYLLSHRRGLSKKMVEVIPNWFEDIGELNKELASTNELFEGIKQNDNLIISYLGNIGICQEIDTIIEAIRKVKNNDKIKFLFAGHGNKLTALRELVKDEELGNVIVLDFLHGQDFYDVLSISDCFLVSLAEGLNGLCVPSKTYSYLMAGKPVIAIMSRESDIVKDLEKSGAGFALEVGDSTNLVNNILYLLDNYHERDAMAKEARNLFLKKYRKEQNTQKYVNMMKKVLGNQKV